MSALTLLVTSLVTLVHPPSSQPVPPPAGSGLLRGGGAASAGTAPYAPPDSVTGRTIRWTWSEGPTAGVTHEHVFGTGGTVTWRVLSGPQEGHSAVEEEYAVLEGGAPSSTRRRTPPPSRRPPGTSRARSRDSEGPS